MNRKLKRPQTPVYAIYAIYDCRIENRIYKISYCHINQLEQIKRYYAKHLQRYITIIFDYFSLKYSKQCIETFIADFDELLQPVILHSYTKEGNRKRIQKAIAGDYFNKSVLDRNGNISLMKMFENALQQVLNEPCTIESLQEDCNGEYEQYTNKDFIPFDFWNYGLTIADLPEHLQKQYEQYAN